MEPSPNRHGAADHRLCSHLGCRGEDDPMLKWIWAAQGTCLVLPPIQCGSAQLWSFIWGTVTLSLLLLLAVACTVQLHGASLRGGKMQCTDGVEFCRHWSVSWKQVAHEEIDGFQRFTLNLDFHGWHFGTIRQIGSWLTAGPAEPGLMPCKVTCLPPQPRSLSFRLLCGAPCTSAWNRRDTSREKETRSPPTAFYQ